MNPKANPRSDLILRELQRSGSVSLDSLCSMLNVSIATARRDLQDLEEQGLLRRTHGGAVSIEPLFYEAFRHDSSFQEQIERHAEEKRRIALAAADLVEDGDTIALTAGTTTTEVVRCIRNRKGVIVVTSTVNVAMEHSKRTDIEVFVTGGFLRGDWFSLVGGAANFAMSQIFVNKAFLGVNGIDAQHGLTSGNAGEAAMNRVIVNQAQKKIAVADRSKLSTIATYRFAGAEQLDLLITDTGASDELIAPFLARGIEVRRV
jgi:DeoR family transcriptional regulator, aga operon transcriptional repressor